MIDRFVEHTRILGAFAKAPAVTGAVAPCSRRLARMLTKDMKLDSARAVVELGPGTGSVTEAIEKQVNPAAMVVAVELNPDFARRLSSRFPRFEIVNECAEKLEILLHGRGYDRVDSIISGLPWTLFDGVRQERLVRTVWRCLGADGRFSTVVYLPGVLFPAARRFRRLLHRHFSSVDITPIIWRNLPPAFVYRCMKQ